jgi:hypothetical protein
LEFLNKTRHRTNQMKKINNNPGIKLGNWLRKKRQEALLIPSVVANELRLSHAAFAELELGVTRWLSNLQVTLVPRVLRLDSASTAEFQKLLKADRASTKKVSFEDLFTREELAPVRLRTVDNYTTPKDNEASELLDAVFQKVT